MNVNTTSEPLKREFFEANIIGRKIIEREDLPSIDNSDNQILHTNFIIQATSGNNKGETFEVYSDGKDYMNGDKVFIEESIAPNQESYVFMNEKIRLTEIYSSILIFALVVIILFGKKGFKSLLSLFSSFMIIFFILIPLTLQGINPILVASGIAFLLLTSMMLITNGRNSITYSAILGCGISIFITIILSYFVVELTSLSGKTDESWSYFNNYLNLNLNFSLIVIASMIIGVIGAVDDGAITQASVVNQLKNTNPHLSAKEYYTKAMEVGRDHAGAMVNTLILAYVASSIPLLMLVYKSEVPLYILINQEIIATEIFRMTIGSIGLLLAIPITTLISVYMFNKDSTKALSHTHTH